MMNINIRHLVRISVLTLLFLGSIPSTLIYSKGDSSAAVSPVVTPLTIPTWNATGSFSSLVAQDLFLPLVGGKYISTLAGGAGSIAAGEGHTCALTGTGGVKCWGWNIYGQLGNGTTEPKLTPVAVNGIAENVSAVVAGNYHNCVLTVNGAIKCWGHNVLGQLGDGTNVDRSTPVDVIGLTSNIKAIAARGDCTCALTVGGGVKCWGSHTCLGVDTPNRNTPIDVSGLSGEVTSIAMGEHVCVLNTNGGMQCWGADDYGQLGDGVSDDYRHTPVDVTVLEDKVAAIGLGAAHTCVVTIAGGVKCWGANWYGQLGNGTTTESLMPLKAFGLSSGIERVVAGDSHTCAVTENGGVKCWGENNRGAVGDGTDKNRYTPVDVFGLANGVTTISVGREHTCVVAGKILCWGSNSLGQLGNGETGYEIIPTEVIDFD